MNQQANEITLYGQAVLTIDLPEKHLKAGDVGTVVDVYDEGKGYSLEFFTLTGQTVAVATVTADAVRPVSAEDRVHVRT